MSEFSAVLHLHQGARGIAVHRTAAGHTHTRTDLAFTAPGRRGHVLVLPGGARTQVVWGSSRLAG